jgi:predicted ATPase/class 3 adenylate cyclase
VGEALLQQLTMPPPPLRERVPTIPAGVEQVVLQALAKDPIERFASVYSYAVALEEAGMEDMSGQTQPMLAQYSAKAKRRGRSLRHLPTGTVTLLFTDIERSTQLLHQLDERYARVLNEYRQIMLSTLHQFRGHEVNIQRDAFFAVFARATDAVSSAIAAQRALASHSWPEGVTVRVRMGLHTGEPQLTVEDYIGLDVHHAAWIMAAGHGGQVLLSQTTRELVERDLPAEVYIRDLGVHRLKDLGRPERLFQLIISGVASDFPPLNTLDSHSNNLPIQPTPLIGQEQEVIAVGQLLQREEVHLVTLTGPGGIGKTRLSMQVAAKLSDHFTDGVFFVDLAPLRDPTLVVPTIAQTLGVREVVGQPMLQTVQERLRQWQVLLLLDNFEQVLSAAVQVADLLTTCPQLKILVTSREVLHMRAEQEYVVPPLALPDTKQLLDLTALSHYAAVSLFLQQAKAVKSDFQLTTATALAVAEICVRLDGLPLAIELAAARIKLLSPQALLSRLSQRLQILTSGARDAPMRQQTLRNTIAWSYDLLKAEEQQLFCRLSVFIGGCTLEAMETIYAARDDGVRAALDGVTSLIDKSLLHHTEQEGDETRLVMLETIREYGLERLTASGEEESIRWAHADYYLALVEEAESHLKGAQQLLWLRRLDREQENLRAALSWLNAHEEAAKALRFCGALWLFWETRGYWSEGGRWLKAALALPGAENRTVVRARALSAAGSLTGSVGELPEAHQLLSESMTLFKELGDENGFVLSLSIVGDMFLVKGDLDEAAHVLEECIALCRQLESTWELSRALILLGTVLYFKNDSIQARALTQEGLTLARERGDYPGVLTETLGTIALAQGDVE